MTWHPILLSILALETLTALLLIYVAAIQLRIVLRWRPADATAEQLLLERAAESAALVGKAAVGLYFLATVFLLIAVTAVLPSVIPGAMCGTGVVQASDGLFNRALFFRLVALTALLLWAGRERENRRSAMAELTGQTARLALLALPFFVLAERDLLRAFSSLDTVTPVDCCAVVYETAASALRNPGSDDSVRKILIWYAGAAVLLLAVAGLLQQKPAIHSRYGLAYLPIPLALLWAWAFHRALTSIFTAYIYGVLAHPCPFCLFIAEHWWIGFPLYGAIYVGIWHSFAIGLTSRLAKGKRFTPERQIKRSARIVFVTVLFAALLAGTPAIWWRMHHGVWLQ